MPKLVIDKFEGKYAFLSNFYMKKVVWRGVAYKSAEHAYQAQKTTDIKWQQAIKAAPTPNACKKIARKSPLIADWDQIKVEIMWKIIKAKFTPGSELAKQLLLTGNAILIEGNWWHDYFWGVCNGKGKNMLGKLLMKRREQLQKS